MKHSMINLGLVCALGLLASSTVYAGEQAEVAAKAQDNPELMPYRKAVKALGGNLKGELQKGMKSGGPLAAIEICNTKAMPISDEISKAQGEGWTVRRTSAKLRNPANAPLTEREAEIINSETFSVKSEMLETVEKDGKPHHLYMKAIGTGPVCLACHGETLQQPIAEKIDALYPEDKARGYKAGDVRGAFVVYAPVKD